MYQQSNLLPIRIISKVVRGFGRGSKELGIPTANISRDNLSCSCGDWENLPTGIYWGFARIGEVTEDDSIEDVIGRVHTAAISIGYNPTYNNKEKTVEPHLIAPTNSPQRFLSSCNETQYGDFYDQTIVLSVIGYLRPELPFEGIEKLTAAIKNDIKEAEKFASISSPITKAEKKWVEVGKEI